MSKKFEYKYSAPTQDERKEIEYIQSQYAKKPNTLTKLDYLRKLDNKVKNTPAAIALAMGIIGTLIFGLGISMVLEWQITIWGAVVGVIGLIPIIMAYFVYNKIYNALKNKYSDEILKLSSELLSDEK